MPGFDSGRHDSRYADHTDRSCHAERAQALHHARPGQHREDALVVEQRVPGRADTHSRRRSRECRRERRALSGHRQEVHLRDRGLAADRRHARFSGHQRRRRRGLGALERHHRAVGLRLQRPHRHWSRRGHLLHHLPLDERRAPAATPDSAGRARRHGGFLFHRSRAGPADRFAGRLPSGPGQPAGAPGLPLRARRAGGADLVARPVLARLAAVLRADRPRPRRRVVHRCARRLAHPARRARRAGGAPAAIAPKATPAPRPSSGSGCSTTGARSRTRRPSSRGSTPPPCSPTR